MHHSSVSWEICLLYFFSWNFIWVLQKERTKAQNVWLVESDSSPDLYFDRLLFRKYVKFQLKRYIQGSYVSWYWRVLQNLKINWFLVSKMPRIWWILIWALKSLWKIALKNCTLIGPLYAKYITFDLKKYRGVIFYDTEESCKVWKRNWLVVWKTTWGGKFS